MKHVTNRGGVTHKVNDAHADQLLAGDDKFRPATEEEIAACDKRHGLILPPKKQAETDAAYLNRLKTGQLIKIAAEGGIEIDDEAPREDIMQLILDEIERKSAIAKAKEAGK